MNDILSAAVQHGHPPTWAVDALTRWRHGLTPGCGLCDCGVLSQREVHSELPLFLLRAAVNEAGGILWCGCAFGLAAQAHAEATWAAWRDRMEGDDLLSDLRKQLESAPPVRLVEVEPPS